MIRRADVDELSRSRFTLTTLSLRNRLLATVALIAAVYPFLPPEVQKYLLDDVGLAAAVAQIFSPEVLGLLPRPRPAGPDKGHDTH